MAPTVLFCLQGSDFDFSALHTTSERREMRRLIVVVLGIIAALSVATPANATTNVDAIISALQKAPIYIGQGTEGTTSDTAASLTSKLHENDNIVLVMLPADTTLTQDD